MPLNCAPLRNRIFRGHRTRSEALLYANFATGAIVVELRQIRICARTQGADVTVRRGGVKGFVPGEQRLPVIGVHRLWRHADAFTGSMLSAGRAQDLMNPKAR